MTDDVAQFYDSLSGGYDRLYVDWAASGDRQGRALQALVEPELGPGPHSILDCSCGIGTQLIGLAPFGHRLTGTDLSPAAVARAAVECRRRNVAVQLDPADMRWLPFPDNAFDVVICIDNSVAHLLTEADLTAALTEWARVLRPGGLAILTTREYDELAAERPISPPVQVSTDAAGHRVVTTQLWDWRSDGAGYRLTHLQAHEQPGGSWRIEARTSRLRAWQREEFRDLARNAGLEPRPWLTAAEAGLHQQALVLCRPAPPQGHRQDARGAG
jgi:glycine/sarcosine N-methyltransferase